MTLTIKATKHWKYQTFNFGKHQNNGKKSFKFAHKGKVHKKVFRNIKMN